MARPVFPRSQQQHERAAQEILSRHAQQTGWRIGLPVPIDLIIEQTYGLRVIYEQLTEPADSMILGALVSAQRRIVINTRHEDLLGTVIGPERFTLAHELAHWHYDAENPDQQSFDFGDTEEVFCYDRESAGLSDDGRIREVNANKLAASVLLPAACVRAAVDDALSEPRDFAAHCGVSQQTLAIRLAELGVVRQAPSGMTPLR